MPATGRTGRPTNRTRRLAVWLALTASVAAASAFVVARVGLPSDGARVAFYENAWSAAGVAIAPIDRPAEGLAPGDIVTAVDGRPLDAWVADAARFDVARPAGEAPIPYQMLRNGSPVTSEVAWERPPVGTTLLEGWSVIVLSIVFATVAAFVFRRRPNEPAAIPLVLAAAAVAGSSLPWFMGVTVSDLVEGSPFLLHSLLTGPLYMVLWPAGLHLALVFPAPLPVVRRWPRLIPAIYAAALGGYGLALLAGRFAAPTTLEWVGTWPIVQVAIIVPLLVLAVAALTWGYLRTTDHQARIRIRWATLGAVASAAIGLVFFWLPQLALGGPLVDHSWIGIAALPLPLGLAAAVLRDRLFDIDVVVDRTLVYGGLTLGVIATYTVAAAAMSALVGPVHGYGISLLATGFAALVALPLRDVLQRSVNRLMYGERDEPWRAIGRLGRRLEWTAEADWALPAIAETVADALRLPYVAIEVAELAGTGPSAEHGSRREPTVTLPLVHGGEAVGRIVLGIRRGEQGFRPDELSLLADLARQAGAAIHAIRLRADLVRSREALVLAREEERRRLRRDLHDGLGPSLAAIGLRADASAATLETDPAAAARLLHELGDEVEVALADIRRLVDGLRPPALDELGLVGAIGQQMTRLQAGGGATTGAPILWVEADPVLLPELPAAVEVAAYRIAVEAVTNAVRHAQATRCRVRVEAGEDLSVEIEDDGRGIRTDAVPGVGLESIQARAEELGGSWRLEPVAGGGTRVLARLPLTISRAGTS
jgi:two-component system, NarL family, sensor kinase